MVGAWMLLSPQGAWAGSFAPFTNEAITRGVLFTNDSPIAQFGAGIAFADLDNDDDPDLILLDGLSPGPPVAFFENDGTGHFTNRSGTALAGLPTFQGASAVACADYDNDGDLDVAISQWTGPERLLRNDGGFTFTDVSSLLGLPASVGWNTQGLAWADVNLDGRVDLYASRYTGQPFIPNVLLMNEPAGFTDVAQTQGIALDDEPTFQSAFVDYDRDGDLDMYVITDKGRNCASNGYTNHLYENINGVLVDTGSSAQADLCMDGMCITYGDINNDSHVDIYVTNTAEPFPDPIGNAMLLNNGDGTFTEDAVNIGVSNGYTGWGSTFLDFDNDGWLDIYVCNANGPNRLFHQNGLLTCADLGPALQVDVLFPSHQVACADIDLDGDVDLAVQVEGRAAQLFINNEGSTRNWSRIDVIGQGDQRYAIGAIIDLTAGGITQRRDVVAGSNYKSQNELPQTFGLNAAATIDTITVMWPGGATRTLTNMPVNQAWKIYPTGKLGDADQDGDIQLDDIQAMSACAGPVSPGCEQLDVDGDGDVDVDDVDAAIAMSAFAAADCNNNGQADLREIFLGTVADNNANGVPDICEAPPCPWDVSGSGNNPDGEVGVADFFALLQNWGPCGDPGDCPWDFTGPGGTPDGDVGVHDFFALLQNWGPCDS
jgi:hypothetical protein